MKGSRKEGTEGKEGRETATHQKKTFRSSSTDPWRLFYKNFWVVIQYIQSVSGYSGLAGGLAGETTIIPYGVSPVQSVPVLVLNYFTVLKY